MQLSEHAKVKIPSNPFRNIYLGHSAVRRLHMVKCKKKEIILNHILMSPNQLYLMYIETK